MRRGIEGSFLWLALGVLLSCSRKPESESDGARPSQNKESAVISLLLPESKTTRYEAKDRPYFESKLKELCPACRLIVANANQDAREQQAQAEAALTNGADVLVLDPVDSVSAQVIAARAKAQGAKVIAYDRLILGTDAVDYYVSFQIEEIGRLQAEGLLASLAGKKDAQVVMIHGAPTDNNGALLKKGARAVLAGKVKIALEYDTPDWSPDKAQEEMTQALTALGGKVDGVYAANDGTASGAIAAMKAAGLSPLPPVTGQDAELAALQRMLRGEQAMTIYKSIAKEAQAAATIAYHLAIGQAVPPELTGGAKANNGKKEIPSVLLQPVLVTRDNLKSTVLAEGFWKRAELCTPPVDKACVDLGI